MLILLGIGLSMMLCQLYKICRPIFIVCSKSWHKWPVLVGTVFYFKLSSVTVTSKMVIECLNIWSKAFQFKQVTGPTLQECMGHRLEICRAVASPSLPQGQAPGKLPIFFPICPFSSIDYFLLTAIFILKCLKIFGKGSEHVILI